MPVDLMQEHIQLEGTVEPSSTGVGSPCRDARPRDIFYIDKAHLHNIGVGFG